MKTIKLIPKPHLRGEIKVPPSKSYAQRALALAALSQNNTILHNLGDSNDVLAAKSIIQSLGAELVEDEEGIIIFRSIDLDVAEPIRINCSESGLSTRIFSAFSLLFDQAFTVDGEGSIKKRTMEMVIDGLQKFGKQVESKGGLLPLTIKGKRTQTTVELDGEISSQFVTAILLVAPFLKEDTEVLLVNPTSKPYISMTLDLMRLFGIEFEQSGFNSFLINGNQEIHRPIEYTVEGDWSSASFWAVAAAISGEIKLTGLKKYSKQGDRKIMEVIENAGAKVDWDQEIVTIAKKEIRPFEFDATECPDLFPPLVVLAACANGKSIIKGANRLIHKESNRGVVLQEEVAKIGIRIELEGDQMIIHGGTLDKTKEVVFSSHNDHRIAMAMSLFSLVSSYPIIIENPAAINKSYPAFFQILKTL